MEDRILESLFLDTHLWSDVIDGGVRKGIALKDLESIQSPAERAQLCRDIAYGQYEIDPPHAGYRTKDDGSERIFFSNTDKDRLLLNAICKWLMRHEGKMVHPLCLSYQEGIGVGKIVKDFSKKIVSLSKRDNSAVVGRKFDIRKYFESVDRAFIHKAFYKVEEHYGHSSVIDLLRKYYDSDTYYDSRKKVLCEAYNGLKQGCAVSTWLANVILYDMDDELSQMKGFYVRFSDDIIYVGEDYDEATNVIRKHLNIFGLELNPKKIEDIKSDKFVTFLGYNIRGGEITLSRKWVKLFQRNIDNLTIRNTKLIKRVREIRRKHSTHMEDDLRRIIEKVERSIARFLYLGDGRYSWATWVLPVVNREDDLKVMNLYCLDAMRAVYTGKTSIGGLGMSRESGIVRGQGRNVKANRKATEDIEQRGWFSGYCSLMTMKNAIPYKWLFRALVADLICRPNAQPHKVLADIDYNKEEILEQLVEKYRDFMNSRPDDCRIERFYAKGLEDMSHIDLLVGGDRAEARKDILEFIDDNVDFNMLSSDSGAWFWQSTEQPELVILKKWLKQ